MKTSVRTKCLFMKISARARDLCMEMSVRASVLVHEDLETSVEATFLFVKTSIGARDLTMRNSVGKVVLAIKTGRLLLGQVDLSIVDLHEDAYPLGEPLKTFILHEIL